MQFITLKGQLPIQGLTETPLGFLFLHVDGGSMHESQELVLGILAEGRSAKLKLSLLQKSEGFLVSQHSYQ